MLSLRKITPRKCLQSQANARWFIRSSLITLESTLILAQSLNFNFFSKRFSDDICDPSFSPNTYFFSIFITSQLIFSIQDSNQNWLKSFYVGNVPKISRVCKGPFKHYVSKEVGRWGQKMAIFADLQYYLCWSR